jgi:hypothetical protein
MKRSDIARKICTMNLILHSGVGGWLLTKSRMASMVPRVGQISVLLSLLLIAG